MFKSIHEKVKKLSAIILGIATPTLLFLIYFLGLSLTWLAALIFDRRLLKNQNHNFVNSSWQDIKGYSNKIDDLQRQF